MIVVDASIGATALLDHRGSGAVARRVLARDNLHAPGLFDVEVTAALRGRVRGRKLDETTARDALRDLISLPVQRHWHAPLLERVWDLRDDATAYDACYLALAEALGARCVTADAALAAVPGTRCEVEVIEA